jgi:hypothetical protein
MAQLVGSDRSKQKPYLQRNHTFLANGKVKSGYPAAYLSVTIRSTNSLIAEEKE